MAKASAKVINFTASSDDDDDDDGNYAGNDKAIKGFGFTHYSQQELAGNSKRLFPSRKRLPIFEFENGLKSMIDNNDNIIIVGSTGCGKTTQIPQFLHKWGYCNNRYKRIAITQPRRVAAMSIAKRVSSEFGSNVGDVIGYHVRFDSTVSNNTQITYLTDGMLLRECIVDKSLKKYSVIVLDEAHLRTINTDILFGLVKSIQFKRSTTRNKLKVIIMSATLQSDKFSRYFNNAKIFNIGGRIFDIQTLYLAKPESNYLDATLTAILQTHLFSPTGDILAFLTGKDEIDSMASMLKAKNVNRKMEILKLYGALPPHEQNKVFKKSNSAHNVRRIILATNIAETSITIASIVYVIDSGKVKRRMFSFVSGIDIFEIEDISKQEAWQRRGRVGRTSTGYCLRLYTESHFEHNMNEFIKPDILRCNLLSAILQLKSIGINDILAFDFLDKPCDSRIVHGIAKLMILGALDINTQKLTDFGAKMSIFPLDPIYSKIILSAHKYNNITNQILIIVSMLSVEGIFYNDDNNERNDNHILQFENELGDHLTLLNVFNCYISNKCKTSWCKVNSLNSKSLRKALQIYKQLFSLYEMHCDKIVIEENPNDNYEDLCKCLLSGLFINIAYYDESIKKYKTYSNDNLVDIHPSSILFNKRPKPQCILYSSMVKTKNIIWLKYCTQIMNDEWLDTIIPNLKLLTKITIKQNKNDKEKEKNINRIHQHNDNDNANVDSKIKPGRAVKRMHDVFQSLKNGKFKSHRKKLQQTNNLKKMSSMNMMKMNQYQYNNYNKHRNNRNNRNKRNNRNQRNNRNRNNRIF